MSAVVQDPQYFAAARELRRYAQTHHLPSGGLLKGCRAALRELDAGRSITIAVLEGQRVMRPAITTTPKAPLSA